MFEAIKDFFDDLDLFDLIHLLACIGVLIFCVIGIYHQFNPPDTIKRNGCVYELQHDPVYSIDEYGCTYVLKETDE